MKNVKQSSRTCKGCNLVKPIAAFLFRQKLTALCKDCRLQRSGSSGGAQSDKDEDDGDGGRQLHKDYYSAYNPEGKKSEKNVSLKEHAIEQRKAINEHDLDKKSKRPATITSFLNRVRATTSLFNKVTQGQPPPSTDNSSNNFLAASCYLSTEIHATNANVLDPSSVRADASRRYWSTNAAVQAQAYRSDSMINPYNTWQRKSFKGQTASENQSAEIPADLSSAEKHGLSEDDSAVEVIKSWRPHGK